MSGVATQWLLTPMLIWLSGGFAEGGFDSDG
jgi:hypothetical protein